jgi:hypothetical protein
MRLIVQAGVLSLVSVSCILVLLILVVARRANIATVQAVVGERDGDGAAAAGG